MTDTAEQEIREGMDAAQVLESPAFQKAFASLEQELLQSWQMTGVKAQEDRERLYLMIKLLQKVKTNLESLMATGVMQKRRLMELEKEKSLLSSTRDFLRF